MTFFSEMKRRNVFRVGVAYALAAWVLLQIVDFVLDAIGAPNWILQVFILAAAVGLPVVLAFSWVFEVTPDGLKRESKIDRTQSITPQTGRKLDRVIIVFLALAVVTLLADRMWNPSSLQAPSAETPARQEATRAADSRPASQPQGQNDRSVAVLPFLALSSGEDDEYFADGLTEEILNALAQLPELQVTSRTSAFHFKGQEMPIAEVAAQLGVANVVEGSVRRSGDRLRVTAQLIRAADGFHLWSESYDSISSDTIMVQEDIAEKIATAMDVILDDARREAMRRVGLRDPEAFIALQKAIELFEEAHGSLDMPDMLARANEYFEVVQQRVPTFAVAYQLHSDYFVHFLTNSATGDSTAQFDPVEVEAAMAAVKADYTKALRYASSPEERNLFEIDLAFVTGSFRGIRALIERFAGGHGCGQSSWLENVALPFGYAMSMIERFGEIRACDPLSSSSWRSEVRAFLWARKAEEALRVANAGSEKAPGEWLSIHLVDTLLALGRYAEAEDVIASQLKEEGDVLAARIRLAAAQGDSEAAQGMMREYDNTPEAADYWSVINQAIAGNRDEANQIASRIDKHPYGTPSLMTIVLWCMCGAPWDLDATPNLAAAIEAGGLQWPPTSPIHFPLKDW